MQFHKDLTPYYRKKGTSKPRAAILIHKTLDNKCCELTQFTTPDLVALKIKRDSKEIIMASSYMDGNMMIPPPNTNRLIDYADKHKLPLIIGSDTNAQHKLWGNKECNKRGEELLEFLTTCGLSWANYGTTPTFLNSRGHNSIIEITITNTGESDIWTPDIWTPDIWTPDIWTPGITVYKTVETGVQMSNFGNKVGHLDPRHLDPCYSTVYKTVGLVKYLNDVI